MTDKKLAVLIVGAGPSGLAMALHLSRLGVKPKIIDKSFKHSASGGGIFLQARTLSSLGYRLETSIRENAQEIQSAIIRNKKGELFSMDLEDYSGSHAMPVTLHQFELEKALIKSLSSHGVAIQWNTELSQIEETAQTCVVQFDASEPQEFDYVIGANGSNSILSVATGSKISSRENVGSWIVADLRLKDRSIDSAQVQMSIHDGRLTGLFPLDDSGGFRVIRSSLSGDHSKAEYWADSLQEFGIFELPEVVSSANYAVAESMIQKLSSDRIFLIGDAAHTMSPIAGQGMNLGMLEAANLGWKIAMVQNGADESILSSYHQERYRIALASFTKSNLAFRAILIGNAWLAKLRDAILGSSKVVPAVRQFLASSLTGAEEKHGVGSLNQEYFDSAQITDYRELPEQNDFDEYQKGPKAGTAIAIYNDQLSQLIEPNSFTALIFDGPEITEDGRLRILETEKLLSELPLMKVFVISSEQADFAEISNLIVDQSFQLHNALHASMETIYIIRPDGHVGFRSAPIDLVSLEQWWDELSEGAPAW